MPAVLWICHFRYVIGKKVEYLTDPHYRFQVMDRAMFHINNAYDIPNLRVEGWVCKTNIPSNTAFRGFGTPQAMLATETMMRHVARSLNRDYVDLVELNMCGDGYVTHYKQQIENTNLRKSV